MAKITFQYTGFPLPPNDPYPQGRTVLRPFVLLAMTASNGESLSLFGLPDSGADACLFPLSVALMLKLDVLRLPREMTSGVGSQSNLTYYDNLNLDLGDGIAFDTQVGFTEGMNSIGFGLLGQSGFFEHCNVEFLQRQKIFTIEPS
jgi:hypothetical protein